jgi:hypothetical protein
VGRIIGCLALLVVGCGSPIVGVWTVSTTITETTGQGGSSTRMLTDQLRIESGGWRVGGGCTAPLTFEGSSARLAQSTVCTVSEPADPLFLLGALGKTAARDDRVEVRRATFTLESGDKLSASVEYRSGSDLSDPLKGLITSFETSSDRLLERAR